MLNLPGAIFALPFTALGWVLAAFNAPAGIPLLKLAWWLGGSADTAVRALTLVQKQQGSQAVVRAAEWFFSRRQGEVASYVAIVCLVAGEIEQGRKWHEAAREAGCDRTGLVEVAELLLAAQDRQPGTLAELSERLMQRHDLSPSASVLCLREVAWTSLLRRQWGRCREYAGRLLAVDADPTASMALWAAALALGDEAAAARHLAGAAKLPRPQRLAYEAIGQAVAGHAAAAASALDELRTLKPEAVPAVEAAIQKAQASL